MPELAELRESSEADNISDALKATQYPYTGREMSTGRASLSYFDKHLVAYMKTMRLRKQSTDLQNKITAMKTLSDNWDTYGAEPPSPQTMFTAMQLLLQMEREDFLPGDALASAEGGVALCFKTANRYADIELLNSGEILAVIAEGQNEPVVWEVEKNDAGFTEAIKRIYEHISA
jgi:hypothetical protein